MYLSTLDVTDGCVATTFKKLGSEGHLSPDKRGKNSQRRVRKIPEEVKRAPESTLGHLKQTRGIMADFPRRENTCLQLSM